MSRFFSRSFLSRWFGRSKPSAAVSSRAFRRVRLAVEPLEDRSVPSVVTVMSTSDDPTDTGSLRYALNNATPGETIDFAADVRTIDLSNTLNTVGLTIGVNLTITNDLGVGPVTIDGGGQFTVFTVSDSSLTASLSGLTIAHGSGGIHNNGTLTVSNSTFSNNSAAFGDGGGIDNYGTLTVSNTTFSNNAANSGGGSIGHGGGIYNDRTLSVSNSTFTNNSALSGGGIYNDYLGTVTVSDSTFANNSTTSDGAGGAMFNLGTVYSHGALTCLAQFTRKFAIFGGRPTQKPRFFRSEDRQVGV